MKIIKAVVIIFCLVFGSLVTLETIASQQATIEELNETIVLMDLEKQLKLIETIELVEAMERRVGQCI